MSLSEIIERVAADLKEHFKVAECLELLEKHCDRIPGYEIRQLKLVDLVKRYIMDPEVKHDARRVLAALRHKIGEGKVPKMMKEQAPSSGSMEIRSIPPTAPQKMDPMQWQTKKTSEKNDDYQQTTATRRVTAPRRVLPPDNAKELSNMEKIKEARRLRIAEAQRLKTSGGEPAEPEEPMKKKQKKASGGRHFF